MYTSYTVTGSFYLENNMRLDSLDVGARFILPSLSLEGILLSVNAGSVTVKYDRVTPVAMENGVKFDRPSSRTTISRATEVEVTHDTV
jgi:hypothetical protein